MEDRSFKFLYIISAVLDAIWIVTELVILGATYSSFRSDFVDDLIIMLAPLCFLLLNVIGMKIWLKTAYVGFLYLIKGGIFCLVGGAVSLYLSDESTALFAAVTGIVLAVIGVFGMYDARKRERRTREEDRRRFEYFGKNYFEAAYLEYAKQEGIENINDLPEETARKARVNSMMPVAYYFQWIIENDLQNDLLTNRLTPHRIKLCKNHEIKAVVLLAQNGEYLTERNFKPEIIPFTRYYFKGDEALGERDYSEKTKNPDGFKYNVEFTWDVYSEMKERIEKAYKEWDKSQKKRGKTDGH